MKKKMLVALFAVMSAASASAYYIEVNNQTGFGIAVTLPPRGRAQVVGVKPQATQRINLSQPVRAIVVNVPSRKRIDIPTVFFDIHQQKRGKDITINVSRPSRRGGLVLVEEK